MRKRDLQFIMGILVIAAAMAGIFLCTRVWPAEIGRPGLW